jgi:HEAT repeat protein
MNRFLSLGLAVLLAGCARTSTDDWIAQLKTKDAARRLHAVKALGERVAEAPRTVPALAQALKDEDAFVRRDAARALGRLGPEARPAVPDLIAAGRDRNGNVRRAATDALQKIDPAAVAKASSPREKK